jgi:hypothetical protein
LAGVDTLVSTRLDPGVDPIIEADRRGAILAVVRIGNKDLLLPGINPNQGGDNVAIGPNGAPSFAGNLPGAHISGVNTPQWGVPMTATPYGLPGPPQLPLGYPATKKATKVLARQPAATYAPQEAETGTVAVAQKPCPNGAKSAEHASPTNAPAPSPTPAPTPAE